MHFPELLRELNFIETTFAGLNSAFMRTNFNFQVNAKIEIGKSDDGFKASQHTLHHTFVEHLVVII